jgi:hypothetical protein
MDSSRGGLSRLDKNLEKLKQKYEDVPIPEGLDFLVKNALKQGRKAASKKKIYKKAAVAAASAAIVASALTIGANTNEVMAKTLADMPIIGGIVKVLTFKHYAVNEDKYNADIKVPEIQGLENKALQNSLNEKYMEENKKLYDSFMADIELLKQKGGGHLGVNSGYVVKTDNDRILSIGRYVVNTVGSSSTVFKYDTIDKKNQVLITLPSLFKDESYVSVISSNIKSQMKERMEADKNKIYWIEGQVEESVKVAFQNISKEQNFYINNEGKLVISFNKYEVAPGYMGVIEFIIPTEALSSILVGNDYIK